MRTTLVVDDRLLRAAKREAAQRGMTLSALVSELVAGQPALTERDIAQITGYDEPTVIRWLDGPDD